MKKFILSVLIILSSLFIFNTSFASCTFGTDISTSLSSCFSGPSTTIITTVDNLGVENGLKTFLSKWIVNISILLSLVAVMYIVVGSLKLVLSTGDDSKIKKAKDTIKWSIVGFLALISVGSLITLLINYMFK